MEKNILKIFSKKYWFKSNYLVTMTVLMKLKNIFVNLKTCIYGNAGKIVLVFFGIFIVINLGCQLLFLVEFFTHQPLYFTKMIFFDLSSAQNIDDLRKGLQELSSTNYIINKDFPMIANKPAPIAQYQAICPELTNYLGGHPEHNRAEEAFLKNTSGLSAKIAYFGVGLLIAILSSRG